MAPLLDRLATAKRKVVAKNNATSARLDRIEEECLNYQFLREGLSRDVKVAKGFIEFILTAVLLFASIDISQFSLRIVSFALYSSWILYASQRQSLTTSSHLTVLLVLLVLDNQPLMQYQERVHEVQIVYVFLTFIHSIGFHPMLRLFIHTPLSSPIVRTGIALSLLLAAIGYYLIQSVSDPSLVLLLQVKVALVLLVSVSVTIGFTVNTAVTADRRHIGSVTDVLSALWTAVVFRLQTGLSVTRFLKLIDAHSSPGDEDRLHMLDREAIKDSLGDRRGDIVWSFLIRWMSARTVNKPSLHTSLLTDSMRLDV